MEQYAMEAEGRLCRALSEFLLVFRSPRPWPRSNDW